MRCVAPIGVFDSGVGGLSVLREVRRQLPHEDLIYVADSAHAPYGDKPAQFIEQRAAAIVEFLAGQDAKAVVVACNTATSAAVASLRSRFAFPIVAMEPAVKPAVRLTRSGVIGVLGTTQTLAGENFAKLLAAHAGGVTVLPQPCPGLAEQVEAGDLEGPQTRALLKRYLLPLLERGADVLVLGCTHYPFLQPTIQEIAGDAVVVVDPSAAVARELCRRLHHAGGLRTDETYAGADVFWTSDDIAVARSRMAQMGIVSGDVRSLPGR